MNIKKSEFTLAKSILYVGGISLFQVVLTIILVMIFIVVNSSQNPVLNFNEVINSIISSSNFKFFSIVLGGITFILLAFIIKHRYGNKLGDIVNINKLNLTFVILIISFSLSFAIVISELDNILRVIFSAPTSSSFEIIKSLLVLPGISNLMMGLFATAIFPAISEEFLFRGVIQRNLSFKYGNNKAILYTSFIFAFVHFDILAFLPIFLVSMVLGYIFAKTGNLIYSIILHFSNNLLIVILVRNNSFGFKGLISSETGVVKVNIGLLVIAIIITLLIAYVMHKFYLRAEEST